LFSCLVRAQAAAASLALPTPLVCLSPSLCLYPFMWCSRAPSVPTHWKAKYRNLAIFTTFFLAIENLSSKSLSISIFNKFFVNFLLPIKKERKKRLKSSWSSLFELCYAAGKWTS
jgi:hypothetical protein